MSYSEARNHFEKARMNTADAVTIEMLDGLKHLSHAIEEEFRTLEQNIRNIQESADRHRTLGTCNRMGAAGCKDRRSLFMWVIIDGHQCTDSQNRCAAL